MIHPHRRPLQAVLTHVRVPIAALAMVLALAPLLVLAPPSSAAEPGTTATPAVGAAGWLADELEAEGGLLTISFGGPDVFPDQGLTIDAILGVIAAGEGDDLGVDLGLDAMADPANLMPYISGFEADTDRAANSTAKTLLLERISGVDVSDGIDLDADLRGLIETDGDDQGRFTDTDSLGFGNYANGIGQALAIIALDRTAGGAPADAIDYLLRQQCSDGSFRLYQFGYVLSFDPFETVETHTCEDAAEGDPDATASALMALLAVPTSPDRSEAVAAAVDHLLGQQQASGGFLGTGAVNANTTGLAASALRAAGEDEAADDGAAFLAALQDGTCAEFGSIAYDEAAFDAGIAADRGQWTRATAQGLLGLGLPDYAGIGSVSPVTAGLDPIECPGAPAPAAVTGSVASIVAGGTLTLTGTGFEPGEQVDVTMHSTPLLLDTLTADADGGVTGPVTIPADTEPGVHTIVLVGQTSATEASMTIEVLPAEPATAAQLPATGSTTGGLAVAGAALVVGGWVLVVASRRRRVAAQAV